MTKQESRLEKGNVASAGDDTLKDQRTSYYNPLFVCCIFHIYCLQHLMTDKKFLLICARIKMFLYWKILISCKFKFLIKDSHSFL